MNFPKTFKEYLNLVNETPLENDREIKFTDTWTACNSDSSISRTSKKLTEFEGIRFYFKNDNSQVIGYVDGFDRIGEKSNRIVFDLTFKNESNLKLKVKNPLFVDTVDIDPKFANKGISSAVYTHLAKLGFTIISDNPQYKGGVKLWKKLQKLEFSI